MRKINICSTKEELNILLKENYGYGYWNFADCLFTVYALYRFKDFDKTSNLIKERTEKLENIKTKFIEVVDFFLIDINFYKTSKYHKSLNNRGYKWTSNNKKSFIINQFQLKSFMDEIDEIIKKYNTDLSIFSFDHPQTYLNPINFIIMIWSHALKKRGRVNWINLEGIIMCFLKFLEEIDRLDIFGIEDKNIPSPESMRFINNKYKGTIHEERAFDVFVDSFKNEEIISDRKKMSFISSNAEKINYLDPLIYLDEYHWDEKSPNNLLRILDLGIAYHLVEQKK